MAAEEFIATGICEISFQKNTWLEGVIAFYIKISRIKNNVCKSISFSLIVLRDSLSKIDLS